MSQIPSSKVNQIKLNNILFKFKHTLPIPQKLQHLYKNKKLNLELM